MECGLSRLITPVVKTNFERQVSVTTTIRRVCTNVLYVVLQMILQQEHTRPNHIGMGNLVIGPGRDLMLKELDAGDGRLAVDEYRG